VRYTNASDLPHRIVTTQFGRLLPTSSQENKASAEYNFEVQASVGLIPNERSVVFLLMCSPPLLLANQ